MKKLVNKLRKRKQPPIITEQPSSSRITNETVAEHRERILAGGRKFKYPLQIPKHRIVLVTVIIMVLTILTFFGIFTWSLYAGQNTSQFTLRLTQVLPYPVASVDSQQVRYSDYLLQLRSSLHYLSTKENVNFSSDDGKRQLEYQKRLALNKAVENAYVLKLAKQQNVGVTDKEVDDFVKREVNGNQLGVSEQVFRQVIHDYYDWSFDEFKASVKSQLLRKKVAAKVDVSGRQRIMGILAAITTGKDFAQEAKEASDDPTAKATGGDMGVVSKTADDPNGLIAAAIKLKPGQTSDVVEGVDGFYLVKLVDIQDSTLRYAKIFVGYKTFDQQLASLKTAGKIQEYIKVSQTAAPSSQ